MKINWIRVSANIRKFFLATTQGKLVVLSASAVYEDLNDANKPGTLIWRCASLFSLPLICGGLFGESILFFLRRATEIGTLNSGVTESFLRDNAWLLRPSFAASAFLTIHILAVMDWGFGSAAWHLKNLIRPGGTRPSYKDRLWRICRMMFGSALPITGLTLLTYLPDGKVNEWVAPESATSLPIFAGLLVLAAFFYLKQRNAQKVEIQTWGDYRGGLIGMGFLIAILLGTAAVLAFTLRA